MRLFYGTVHAINAADYTAEQIDAWAPRVPDQDRWDERLSRGHIMVAVAGGEVVGFVTVEDGGSIDLLYCRKDWQGRGIGARLHAAVERMAAEHGWSRLSTQASITARPFFERNGYRVVRRQTVTVRGVAMDNFVMEKVVGG